MGLHDMLLLRQDGWWLQPYAEELQQDSFSLPGWALAAYLLSSAAQELICLSKFCLFILVHAKMMVATCAEGSDACVGNPSSCEKLGIDNYSENWNDLCGLEDGLSYKIMFPIK